MRVSAVVLALSCLITGYALAGTRVRALEDVSAARRFPAGVGVGTHVLLGFSSDPKSVECTINRIDAGWVRCAQPENSLGPSFAATFQPTEAWYDLAHVISVTKLETQR